MKLEAEIDGRLRTVGVERREGRIAVTLDGEPMAVDARAMDGFFLSLLIDDVAHEVTVEQEREAWRVQVGIEAIKIRFLDPLRRTGGEGSEGAGAASEGRTTIASLMPGKVVRVLVKPGDQVEEGQDLVVVEAMKMENAVPSPRAGRVLELAAAPGDTVESGAPLVVVG